MHNHRIIKFISYYKSYKKLLLADLACAFLVSATTLALPLCSRWITKKLSEQSVSAVTQIDQIYVVGALMLGLVILHVIGRAFVDYQGHMMGARMESDMRRELFDHFQKLSFRFYDDQKTGQLMTRISNDSLELSEFFHHMPEDIVISLLNFMGALVILMVIHLPLGLIILAILIVMAIYAVHFNRKMNSALLRSKDRIGDINTQVEDTLSGIRVVQSFTNDQMERDKFAKENNRFVESRRDVYRSEAYYFGGLTGFTQFMSIGVIILGSIQVLHRSLDLADLLTFVLCVGILIEPINRFSNFTRLYQEGLTSFNRIMDILEIEPDICDSDQATEFRNVTGRLEFRNVSFKYREEHDFAIKNISLKINAGEFIALVGPSGVGKTTLCSLIPRFYDVNEGSILIDGQNIQNIQLQSLRRSIGVVHQDVYLFNGTIEENIRYGRPEASKQEVIEAAKNANAHDFIMALPRGYETDMGQRGIKLSGGQKQRLSIARVFLKDPAILIFDEATSSLDNESERAVQESLERLMIQRTAIVIAHRLSTVRNAHRIIVLNESGIAEQGTHGNLIERNGVYAGLYSARIGEVS